MVTYQTRLRVGIGAALVGAGAVALALRPEVSGQVWPMLAAALAALAVLTVYVVVAGRELADRERAATVPARPVYGVPARVRMRDGEPVEVESGGRVLTIAAVQGVASGAAPTVVHWAVSDASGARYALTQDTDNDLPRDAWWLADWSDRPNPGWW